ncbi:hypothetical protein ACX80G_15095, partial [Arthrobacter sp. HLT1-21]
MKSSTASPTGKGFVPESGADSGSTNGSADTAAGASGGSSGTSGGTPGGASGGYGPGGPLGVGAVWTAPVGDPPNTSADASADTSAGAFVGGGPDADFGAGPDAGVRSSEVPPVLMGGVAVAAVVGLDAGRTLDLIKDLGGLRSWVDA